MSDLDAQGDATRAPDAVEPDAAGLDVSDLDGSEDADATDAHDSPDADSFGGDGVISGGETCDDGNQRNGDGYNFACQVEPGYQCLLPGELCGDGIIIARSRRAAATASFRKTNSVMTAMPSAATAARSPARRKAEYQVEFY